ncbi:TerC family protein [Maritalea porphyrae]|jgi:predicted tellurium resistance membrane protein TerC|uniref:TerC family protein n=1 Tax=Maritalea porphyrae TaxID=880732 RepID=UPI0022AE9B71|nr:tellurium resistance protein TerC [Maritalea porphyrae]MCZ4273806.1 tellurium resistance protein TerC [Maritalea porphyrae]
MESFLSIENWITLLMLFGLLAVLGFDNLLYISLESQRVEKDKQQYVRRMGIGLAVIFRLVLLFALIQLIEFFQDPFLKLQWTGFIETEMNVHAFIVLVGGGFIIYTAIQEIFHMISVHDIHDQNEDKRKRSVGVTIFWLVAMNLVFSFDSVLSSIALTDEFWVMAVAIVLSGIMMIVLSDYVSDFLQRNRMYQVLGLFILLLVGILLLSEGGHLAHLKLFGHEILPMAKSTFYFVLFVMVAVDVVQSRYQKKLMLEREQREKLIRKVMKDNEGAADNHA